MAIAYWTIFSLTFAVILSAFLKDHSTAKSNFRAWMFVLVASLIWPITLPFIISSKLRMHKLRNLAKTGFSSNLNTSPINTSPASEV